MSPSEPEPLPKKEAKALLLALQIELVKLQRDVCSKGRRVLVLVEGRDAAGKDGMIRALTENLSPREARAVSLPKPSERERSQWYFQRFVAHLPSGGQIVAFNRSWYNRAGVERVMGFCTERDVEEFFDSVNELEGMLVRSGIELTKLYLDVSRKEQRKRLGDRRKDPLKKWKMGPIDAAAIAKWDDYTRFRDEMFRRTHTALAPWTVVRADDKRTARVAFLADLLHRLPYRGRGKQVPKPDERVVRPWSPAVEETLER